jgi:DNA-binding transcriptional MerR regulator
MREHRADVEKNGALRIGQLARASGYNAKTLRYYENVGLLRPRARTRAGYRTYDSAAIERLRLIANAQDLGFTLEEIRQVLDAGDAGADPCVHTLALVDRQLERLAVQANRLRELRKGLRSLRTRVSAGLGKAPPRGGLCSCLTDGFVSGRRSSSHNPKQRRVRKEKRRELPVS